MGPNVTQGMDELDLLVQNAYPHANRELMDKYKALCEEVGADRVYSVLKKTAETRKSVQRDREEKLERDKQERMARIEAAKATKGKKANETATKQRKPIYLRPDMAPTPNCIVRSALFGIIRPGRRRRLEEYEDLPTYGVKGWKIRWKGVQLDQADADLWLCLLRKAGIINNELLNGGEVGNKAVLVEFTRGGLLRELKRSKGGANKKWLDKALHRLRDCDIQVEDPTGRRRYSAKLLGERYEDDDSDMEIIEVNAKLANLLGSDLSLLNFSKRLELKKDQTAKWLHAFLNSHKGDQVYTISLRKLHELSGAPKDVHKFRHKVIRALDKMPDVVKAHEEIGSGMDTIFIISLTKKKDR